MRTVAGLLKVINKSDLVDFYNNLLTYGSIHGAKLPSLNEFLELSSKEKNQEPNNFDESTDKILEAAALKRLEERRLKHGK